jgi:ADP-heptose:LPS heptosyltransferase
MHAVELFMKRLLISILHRSVARAPCAPGSLPLASLKKILVVRQHDQLGDLLISTPAVRAIRLRFPDAFIAVVVRDYTRAMMENNPNINKLIVFHDRLKSWSWRDARAFWHDLRGDGGFDCAVVLNTVSRSFSSDLIALLSRARFIVGPDHIKHDSGLPERIYNVVTHRDQGKKTEIEHNLDVVRALGAVPDSLEYDLVPTHEERLEAEATFHSLSIERSKLVVGVHFGTLSISRRFPLERLAEVIDAMISKYEVEVVLIVGPHEIELRNDLLTLLLHRVHSAPLMPIRVSAAFMTHLDLFMCNDTGTLHIASSQRTPTVSFHGLNDPAVWKPPHERHFPVIAADRIITSISVQQTMAVIAKAIDYVACSARSRPAIPEHRER